MNGWLIDQCVAYAKAHLHPEHRDETIWLAFQTERSAIMDLDAQDDSANHPGRQAGASAIICFPLI